MDKFATYVAFILGEVAKLLDIVMEPKAKDIVTVIAGAFFNYGQTK